LPTIRPKPSLSLPYAADYHDNGNLIPRGLSQMNRLLDLPGDDFDREAIDSFDLIRQEIIKAGNSAYPESHCIKVT
jgi:hypothetical protein